nr:putative alcohol dehydrogenase superfamily, zinc-type [Tanacetum cinerariifolium]
MQLQKRCMSIRGRVVPVPPSIVPIVAVVVIFKEYFTARVLVCRCFKNAVENIYNKIKNFIKVLNQRQYMRLDQFEHKLNELEGSVRSLENLISDVRLDLPGNQTSVEVNRSDVHANKTN